MKFLVLWFIQTHLLAAAGNRARGVRRPRRMARTRFLHDAEPEEQNIFLGLGKGKGKGYARYSKSKGPGASRSKARSSSKGKGERRSYVTEMVPEEVPEEMTEEVHDEETGGAIPPPPVTLHPTSSATVTQTALDLPARKSNFCQVNGNGVFGAESGDSSLVVFIYQVEVEPGTTPTHFEKIILPPMELAIVDLMIPSMFSNICGLFRRLMTVTGTYLGISALPNDHALSGGT